MSDLLDDDWLERARIDAHDGKRFRSDEVLAMLDHIEALGRELATLRASVVDALSSAGPEVAEDERAP